ncbi:MAG: long-chain-fatty-acid--CoA ligase FadD13 [Hydrocarboniphaga sp.]|uniref:acyl-CoA synthetase n=1 Tax=Hydrocarboniphaga sp. TaxID=2033016 RepID=UPI00262EAEDE|nr:acyl-CoA synthetase [Hydrocarboniphaga sp.]MDB5969176.1 long-chain-fatty-acid--CoA ligase FadD13 [Hydrocarboniphaga sp.]
MYHPAHHARSTPDKPAIVMADSGRSMSYAELDARSNQIAHLFRRLGLKPQAHIALLMENNFHFMQLIWGAQRSGLVFTAIGTQLKRDEVRYIVNNSDAAVVITSPRFSSLLDSVRAEGCDAQRFFVIDGEAAGYENWDAAVAAEPTTPIANEEAGVQMLYSSGTTGQPKGVLPKRAPGLPIDAPSANMMGLGRFFRFDEHAVYLSTAPLYHGAPLTFAIMTGHFGGTVVILEKFEPEKALQAIENKGVTHVQCVPIMFVRLLDLPIETRQRYSTTSLKVAFHSAAPCPVPIKRQMIQWWGAVISEYYASTEGAGFTALDTPQWLAHPGSVGKPFNCTLHILDEEENEAAPGMPGTIYFSGPQATFQYYKEPDKTRGSYNAKGWATVGDIGYVDGEGYLYLTDRKSFMIISGGVNIYPQEVESLLLTHPKIADVAVFGVPNREFGEEVKAVVQPKRWEDAGKLLEAELIGWCRERIANLKVPRSVDFERDLPRLENGKLYKRLLADRYK